MRLSAYAGVAIVPTLARIVLATAFITAGYAKLFTSSEFSVEQAQVLKSLGVSPRLKSTPAVSSSANVMFASYHSEQNAGDPEDKGAQEEQEKPVDNEKKDDEEGLTGSLKDVGEDMKQEAQKLGDKVKDTYDTAKEEIGAAAQKSAGPLPELEPGVYEAKSLHHITLLLHDSGWAYPVGLAWLAALTEFVGGSLLLVGFLSRIWGLGLAIVMGAACYLVSCEKYLETGMFTVAQMPDKSLYNMVFAQASLFVLAFGIFLTGPGPLSIDHILFGRKPKPHASRGKHGNGEIDSAEV